MKYVSDDGKKVFNTEQECLNYEAKIKKQIEEERKEKQTRESERKNKLKAIRETYKELQKQVAEYINENGVAQELYFTPVHDFINMLYH